MTSIDTPGDSMTKIHCPAGGVLTIELDNVDELIGDRAEFLGAIVDGVAFVNYRRIDVGEQPVLALSYFRRA